ncbi:hypothetical protein BO82DRAFT_125211 [Aspergillus uvarum CBS 121591]|uniref:Uncharacterized protein n=1 Tax=Aspergillus uvarum CBS 121591 TaxID=1448315 RepID=A0A319C3Z3_9EURO|nr:hypothetical protein BO82DRAFT_125211 [Aspergillus uvarum CBS 121591]PYH79885.1 hypothetical protein BO82DRAFT_125211 [Aspergillus uvarum CBS 121591]
MMEKERCPWICTSARLTVAEPRKYRWFSIGRSVGLRTTQLRTPAAGLFRSAVWAIYFPFLISAVLLFLLSILLRSTNGGVSYFYTRFH